MPVPTTDGKHIARQFVPHADPKYGLYNCLSDEEYNDIGGRVWYNEQKELNQMRSIHMTGPQLFGTGIKPNTCVVEIGEWDLTIPGVQKNSYSRRSPEPDTKRYAAGVNFGYAKHGSRYNTYYVLDASEPQFRQSAILAGLLTVLEKIGEITKKYSSIRDIKIRTDSAALVDALAWGESFERAYQDVIRDLTEEEEETFFSLEEELNKAEEGIKDLEKRSIHIEFWLLDSGDMVDANDLAIEALNNEFGTERNWYPARRPSEDHDDRASDSS